MSQANCILTLELDVELLESGSRAARCIVRLIFHKTGQLGGWPGCLPSLTKWMYEQNLMKWCWPNRKVNVTYGPNGEAFENHLTVYHQVRYFACSYMTNAREWCPSYVGFFASVFFLQNDPPLYLTTPEFDSIADQSLELNLMRTAARNCIWGLWPPSPWLRPHQDCCQLQILIAFLLHLLTSHHIAHIRPIWAHFGYLCTFWCRCTFTDLNIMRWCTTLTNMRYATII